MTQLQKDIIIINDPKKIKLLNKPFTKQILGSFSEKPKTASEIAKTISFPKEKIIIVNDLSLSENFLVYIDKVDNVTISENSDEYDKYLNLSRVRMVSDLFNTYDIHLKQKYKIDINYQALDEVKNYFN